MNNNWLLLAGWLLFYALAYRWIGSTIAALGRRKALLPLRIKYVTRVLRLLLFAISLIVSALILGQGYGQIALFMSSVFAVLGVALIAQWSMLSNLTASLIIFFAFPYRVGHSIKIVDKDEDISGTIEDIGLFHVLVRRADGDLISYPNNLILQKAVIRRDSLTKENHTNL